MAVKVLKNKTKFKSKLKTREKSPTYTLPEEKSAIVKRLGGYTTLIFGRKKIGKTTMCNQFPGALFLFFEPGGKALEAYQEPMTSWKKFVKYVDLLCSDSKFKTIIIDTADLAYEECYDYICDLNNIDDPTELGWGEGWRKIKKEFRKQINRLLHSGKGVIFISHQTESEIEDRKGNKQSMKTNTLSKQAKEIIEGLVDIWVCYDYEGDDRILRILGNEENDCGHRIKDHFRYTDGSRIKKIKMGNSEEEAYSQFIKAFNNELERPKGGDSDALKKKSKLKKKTLGKNKK